MKSFRNSEYIIFITGIKDDLMKHKDDFALLPVRARDAFNDVILQIDWEIDCAKDEGKQS